MYTTIIIDDERLARNELKKLIQPFEDIELIGEASNADEAKQLIEELNPDLIFLDIQMPEKTGFDLLNELEVAPKVVFVTAYDEFAIRAFEVNALDYLMKPVEPARLEKVVRKLNSNVSIESNEINNGSKEKLSEEDQVFVKDGEKCWFVKLADVKMFESVGNYAKVYFAGNKPLILKSLNALEERLDERFFFRANRKQIVNLRKIQKVEPYFNGGLLLTLDGEAEKIEVSRRQAVKFRDMSL